MHRAFRPERGMGMRKPLTAFLLTLLLVGVFALAACDQDGTMTTNTSETTGSAASGSSMSTVPSSEDAVSTITSGGPNGDKTTTTGNQLTSAWQRFTSEDLAQFDGKDGRPAYVAVDGVVYDVSDSSRWPEGVHTVCNLGAMAGQDLSDILAQAPARMRALMKEMPVVGSLD